MFNDKKEVAYYYRASKKGLGPSKVRVFAAEPGKKETYEVTGKLPVTIKTFDTKSEILKPYIYIEEYREIDLVTYDILYGNLNISELKKETPESEAIFEGILKRDIVELITRKGWGIIPDRLSQVPYDKNKIDELKIMIKESAFEETREIENQDKKESKNSSNNTPQPRKGLWDKLFGEQMEKSMKAKKQSSSQQTDDDLVKYQASENPEKVLFYRSGVVLLNGNTFLKFNYMTKDRTIPLSKPLETDSFLISDFDDDKLLENLDYRKAFVKEVLNPYRLKSTRSVKHFPYIGEFTSLGTFQNNLENWNAFNKLNTLGEKER